MSKVQIGGKTYNIRDGANVSVINNRVIVDGQELPSDNVRIETVVIEGNTGPVRVDGSLTVQGSITGDVNVGGSCTVRDVTGDVKAGGSIHAQSVAGSAKAGGSVHAGKVGQ